MTDDQRARTTQALLMTPATGTDSAIRTIHRFAHDRWEVKTPGVARAKDKYELPESAPLSERICTNTFVADLDREPDVTHMVDHALDDLAAKTMRRHNEGRLTATGWPGVYIRHDGFEVRVLAWVDLVPKG